MLQRFNILGSKPKFASSVTTSNTPVIHIEADVIVASPEAEAQMVKRRTVENLKDVAAPCEGDIEADFAFMSDILSQAGVMDSAPATQQHETVDASVTQPAAPVPELPKKTSAPAFVPLHKRGAAASGKPVFAVQSGPRSPEPAFRQDQVEEDATDAEAKTDAQEAPVVTEDFAHALEILTSAGAEVTSAPTPVGTPGVVFHDQGALRKAQPKSKKPKKDITPRPVLRDPLAPPNIPGFARRLLSMMPRAEFAQGMSEFARARLARDPFDRLIEEAGGA